MFKKVREARSTHGASPELVTQISLRPRSVPVPVRLCPRVSAGPFLALAHL